jgi:hypothetical protein
MQWLASTDVAFFVRGPVTRSRCGVVVSASAYRRAVIAWYPRHWGQTTVSELAKFLVELPPKTTGISFCGNVELGDAMIDALGPVLPRLRHLALTGVPIGPRGMHALANDARASALEVLLLGGVMARDILGPTPLPRDKLDPKLAALATCRLGDDGLHALGQATQLAARLHTLEVNPTLDARTVEIIANRRGTPALRTLYLNYTSQIATGGQDIWTDWTGAEIGSSPEYLRLDDLVKKHLPHQAIKIQAGPTWPATWLGLTG